MQRREARLVALGRDGKGGTVPDIEFEVHHHSLADVLELALKIRFLDSQCGLAGSRSRQSIVGGEFQYVAASVLDGLQSFGNAPGDGGLYIRWILQVIFLLRW